MKADSKTVSVLRSFGLDAADCDDVVVKHARIIITTPSLTRHIYEFDDFKELFLELPRFIKKGARNAAANDIRTVMLYSIADHLGCHTCSEIIQKAPYNSIKRAYSTIARRNEVLGWLSQSNVNDMVDVLRCPIPADAWDGTEEFIKYINIQ